MINMIDRLEFGDHMDKQDYKMQEYYYWGND